MNNKAIQDLLKHHHLALEVNDLIIEALTHSSYANEHQLKSNERLEFLGDAVLGLCVAEYIYQTFPKMPEGEMTKLRASFVCEDANANYAKIIGLDKVILLGNGEEASGGRIRPAVLNDVFEAFLGALYMSSDLATIKQLLTAIVFPTIKANNIKPFIDYKSQLQEYVQAESRSILVYRVDFVDGPPHKRIFTISALLDGLVLGKGTASTKKEAEQMAAKMALTKMVK